MKIIRLSASNVKRLTAVEITPDGTMVVISGRNGQGKTSVLDAIWFALGGGAATKGTSRPIRDGASKAEVTLDLGDLTVTRTWAASGTSNLKVTAADGARLSSPQKVLDELVGRLSFDPLAFASATPKEQLATLLEVVELPFDPTELAAERTRTFDERTEVNREAKSLRAQVDAMAVPPPGLPPEEVALADLVAEHRQALDDSALRKAHEQQVTETMAVIEDLERRLTEARTLLNHLQVAAADLPPEPDMDAIATRMATAEETNAAVRAARERTTLASQLAALEANAEHLTTALADIDARKATALEGATMPIDGLGFDDDGVTYRSVPFNQCSGAEKLRVSIAMAIALNPTLRVIRITDGSLLDADGMALVADMATAHDMQVWVERVAGPEPVGVVIEDGHVAEVVADDPTAGSLFDLGAAS